MTNQHLDIIDINDLKNCAEKVLGAKPQPNIAGHWRLEINGKTKSINDSVYWQLDDLKTWNGIGVIIENLERNGFYITRMKYYRENGVQDIYEFTIRGDNRVHKARSDTRAGAVIWAALRSMGYGRP